MQEFYSGVYTNGVLAVGCCKHVQVVYIQSGLSLTLCWNLPLPTPDSKEVLRERGTPR